MTGVEIWAKIWDILPPCKKGDKMGRMSVDILWASPTTSLILYDWRAADGPILIYKFPWQKK